MSLEINNYTIKINQARSLASTVSYADVSPMLFYLKALQNDINTVNNAYNNNPPTPSVQMNIYAVTSLGI